MIKWDEKRRAEFERRMEELARGYPTAAMKAAGFVAISIINDALNEDPTVPLKFGNLRSSGTFEVMQESSWRSVKIWVGFNTPYAARVHELPQEGTNWTTPGSGSKYLETKLQRHAAEYVAVWTRRMNEDLGFK